MTNAIGRTDGDSGFKTHTQASPPEAAKELRQGIPVRLRQDELDLIYKALTKAVRSQTSIATSSRTKVQNAKIATFKGHETLEELERRATQDETDRQPLEQLRYKFLCLTQ